jgi:hypothetical protein
VGGTREIFNVPDWQDMAAGLSMRRFESASGSADTAFEGMRPNRNRYNKPALLKWQGGVALRFPPHSINSICLFTASICCECRQEFSIARPSRSGFENLRIVAKQK